MKITFLANHIKINGGNRAFLTYAHRLGQRGHEVTVLVPIENPFKRFVGNIIRRKPTWFNNFSARIKWVASFDEKNIPAGDIIIATAWQTAEPVAICPASRGKKFYFIQHYESLYHGPANFVDATYRLPLHKIVISGWLQELLLEKFKAPSKLIVTPVDPGIFHEISGLRSPEKIRILALDHTAKWKGTETAGQIVEAIKKESDIPIEFVLFGVRRKQSGISCDRYIYNPPQAELASLYSSADIYLCPSEYEGLGMPSMEAMACGTAVVTFDNGGSRDYAFDGRTTFVARRGDVADLKLKLKQAVVLADARKQIAQEGQKFIKTHFSWDKAVETMEKLFINA